MTRDASAGEQIVVVLVKDLFFSVKVRNELNAQGYTPVMAKDAAQFVTLVTERQPVLGIVDLTAGVDWALVEQLAANPATAEVSILAFGPHKDIEGRRAAKAAGVVRVVSNSQFHADLPGFVARYARS